MTTQIVVHLTPQEIDWFEWQSKQFKLGSYFVKSKIIIDVTLNLNLIDWGQSKLPEEFFITKFKQIESLWDWAETKFVIDKENKCLGCGDKRKESINKSTSDNILYLDSDVLFRPELLSYITQAAEMIPNEYYIISPQTTKLWDISWDCLINQNYTHLTPVHEYLTQDPFNIISKDHGDISIRPIEQFKFGGGWFNLLSTKLLKLTDIPDSLNPYGPDDTYVMMCCDVLKQSGGYDIQQYILENMLVVENIKYRWSPYKDFLHPLGEQTEFRTRAENNLHSEVQNFSKTLKKIGISLGWNCGPAGYGVENGIRETKANGYRTCPFDEMVSNLPGVVECIRDDFKYFLDDEFLEVKPVPFTVGGTKKGEYLIYNTRYNFFFNHESPGHANLYIEQNWAGGINHYVDNNFRLFKERYNRRVQAFKDYIQQGLDGTEIKFIVFRYNHDVKMLDDMLKEKYPTLKYRIIVVSPFAPLETVDFVYKQHLLMGMKEENAQIEVKHEL